MTDQELMRQLLSDARDALEIAPDIGHERAIQIALRRIKSALEHMKKPIKT